MNASSSPATVLRIACSAGFGTCVSSLANQPLRSERFAGLEDPLRRGQIIWHALALLLCRPTPRISGAAQPRPLHALVRPAVQGRMGVRLNTRASRDAASRSPRRNASRTASSLRASSRERYGDQPLSSSRSSTSTSAAYEPSPHELGMTPGVHLHGSGSPSAELHRNCAVRSNPGRAIRTYERSGRVANSFKRVSSGVRPAG